MPISEVVSFSVPHLQVLDEHGNLDQELDPGLDRDQLLVLYRYMVLAREADQRMLKLQRQGRLGTFPPCTGHEAVACGATLAMGERDWFVGSYRELGGRLMRGEPLASYLNYYNGWEEGSPLPASARTLPTQVILGSQIPHAVGLAHASRYRGEDSATVVFFGDGASSQGDFHEAANFAGVWKAPVVFLCQNNQWAISVPRATQSAARTLAQRAFGYGFRGVQVDGNDVLAVYRATREALEHARAGEGPTLIEAVTYRVLMHTTADDPKKYRTEEEERVWWERDPLKRFRTYLEQRGHWSEGDQEKLEAEIKQEVDDAVQQMESFGEGARPDAPFDHVFGTRHPMIEEQREMFLRNLKLREDSDG